MMQGPSKNNWRQHWVFAALAALLVALPVSRALVSFASVLIVVPFLGSGIKIKRTHLLGVVFLLLPIALSFAWSEDKTNWWNVFSVKLPLLTMMMGLASATLPGKQQKQIAWVLLGVVTAAGCWSLAHYSIEIQEAYLRAKTLPTPMDNDHIRFSWLVVVALLLGMRLLTLEKNRKTKGVLVVMMVFLVVYLHILAAKTGLVCLYGGAVFYVLYQLLTGRKWRKGIALLVAVAGMAFVFYQTVPTLRNRIQYVVYDVENLIRGRSMPGYNDAARWTSMRAGYGLLQQHPLMGVGAGDMAAAVNQWHEDHHPQSLPYERFLPANEWLVYGSASGWPGLLCFTAGLLLLLYTTTSRNALSCTLSVITVVPFLIDDTFEGQYGVVILSFIAFFGQRMLDDRKPVPVRKERTDSGSGERPTN